MCHGKSEQVLLGIAAVFPLSLSHTLRMKEEASLH